MKRRLRSALEDRSLVPVPTRVTLELPTPSIVSVHDVTSVRRFTAVGGTRTYRVFGQEEGSFLLYSTGANFGGPNAPNDGAQLTAGLFGAINVQPKDAEWYRSQVTRDDLEMARDAAKGNNGKTPDDHPIIKYDSLYPLGNKNAGTPILKMLNDKNEIIYTDLTALITGKNHGLFTPPPGDPNFAKNYA